MNIKNGLQLLVIAGGLALTLVLCMTSLAITDHSIPTAFPDALIALVGGLVGAGIYHLKTNGPQ